MGHRLALIAACLCLALSSSEARRSFSQRWDIRYGCSDLVLSDADYTCPPGYQLYARGPMCYRFYSSAMRWDQANNTCASSGGRLAEVEGRCLTRWLVREFRGAAFLRRFRFWFGMRCHRSFDRDCRLSRGGLRAQYRGYWNYAIMDAGTGEQCAEMDADRDTDDTWSLSFCDRKRRFVCEADPCTRGWYRCQGGRRITRCQLCDGRADCPAGDDEDQPQCPRQISCGGTFNSSIDATGLIVSPSYPSNYPSNVKCVWTIYMDSSAEIKLTVNDFRTEFFFDKVEVYLGEPKAQLQLRVPFSGSLPSGSSWTMSKGADVVSLVFTSDYSRQYKGFNISYAVTKPTCAFTQSIGSSDYTLAITSAQLNAGKTCTWLLTNSLAASANLSFSLDAFAIPAGCSIKFYRGSTSDETQLLTELTGTRAYASSVISDLSVVLVETYCSFTADLTGISGSILSGKVRPGCSIELSAASSGTIETPSINGVYPNYANCQYIVQANVPRWRLVVDYFDLEIGYDYVNISSNQMTTSYGFISTPQTMQQGLSALGSFNASTRLTIVFKSDFSVQRRGFRFSYSVPCFGSLGNIDYGMTFNYTCPYGSVLGNASLSTEFVPVTCTIGGIFTPRAVVCLPKTCGRPTVPANSIAQVEGLFLGNRTTYACWPGYQLVGSSSSMCTLDGWTAAPTCEPIQCSIPTDKDPNLELVVPGIVFRFGGLAVVRCKPGYTLLGPRSLLCDATGNWTSPWPTCLPPRCLVPRSLSTGRFMPFSGWLSVGQNLTLVCDTGYTPSMAYTPCESSGSFRDRLTCIDVNECTVTKDICNNDTCVNLIGSYTCRCRDGYAKYGGTNVCVDVNECRSRWTNDCDHYCENTPGSYECSCRPGYSLFTSALSASMAAKGISLRGLKLNRSCVEQMCPTPSLEWSRVFWTASRWYNARMEFPYGTLMIIVPRIGYQFESNSLNLVAVACRWVSSSNTVAWVSLYGSLVNASSAMCPDSAVVMNGQVSLEGRSRSYMASYNFTCNGGFQVDGPGTVQCTTIFGRDFLSRRGYVYDWKVSGKCSQVRSCPGLSEPRNGRISYSALYFIGSLAMYRCQPGYYLNGTSTRLCQPTGAWTGADPSCEILQCPAPNITDSVVSIDNSTAAPWRFNDLISYQCRLRGYKLNGMASAICGLGDQFASVQTNQLLTAFACDGIEQQLGCPAGSRLWIYRANYGYEYSRPVNCPDKNYPTAPCGDPIYATNLVSLLCNNQSSCWIPVYALAFQASSADFCQGKSKYLEVNYVCQTGDLPVNSSVDLLRSCDRFADGLPSLMIDAFKPGASLSLASSLIAIATTGCTAEKAALRDGCLSIRSMRMSSPSDRLVGVFLRAFSRSICSASLKDLVAKCAPLWIEVTLLRQKNFSDFCILRSRFERNCATMLTPEDTTLWQSTMNDACSMNETQFLDASVNLLANFDLAPPEYGGVIYRTYESYNDTTSRATVISGLNVTSLVNGSFELFNTSSVITIRTLRRISISSFLLAFESPKAVSVAELQFMLTESMSSLISVEMDISNERSDQITIELEKPVTAFGFRIRLSSPGLSATDKGMLRLLVNYSAEASVTVPEIPIPEEKLKCSSCGWTTAESDCLGEEECNDNEVCMTNWQNQNSQGPRVRKSCQNKEACNNQLPKNQCDGDPKNGFCTQCSDRNMGNYYSTPCPAWAAAAGRCRPPKATLDWIVDITVRIDPISILGCVSSLKLRNERFLKTLSDLPFNQWLMYSCPAIRVKSLMLEPAVQFDPTTTEISSRLTLSFEYDVLNATCAVETLGQLMANMTNILNTLRDGLLETCSGLTFVRYSQLQAQYNCPGLTIAYKQLGVCVYRDFYTSFIKVNATFNLLASVDLSLFVEFGSTKVSVIGLDLASKGFSISSPGRYIFTTSKLFNGINFLQSLFLYGKGYGWIKSVAVQRLADPTNSSSWILVQNQTITSAEYKASSLIAVFLNNASAFGLRIVIDADGIMTAAQPLTVIFGVNFRAGPPSIRCFNCTGVSNIDDCIDTVECNGVCTTRFAIAAGNTLNFTAGCSATIPPTSGNQCNRSQVGDSCTSYCRASYCNTYMTPVCPPAFYPRCAEPTARFVVEFSVGVRSTPALNSACSSAVGTAFQNGLNVLTKLQVAFICGGATLDSRVIVAFDAGSSAGAIRIRLSVAYNAYSPPECLRTLLKALDLQEQLAKMLPSISVVGCGGLILQFDPPRLVYKQPMCPIGFMTTDESDGVCLTSIGDSSSNPLSNRTILNSDSFQFNDPTGRPLSTAMAPLFVLSSNGLYNLVLRTSGQYMLFNTLQFQFWSVSGRGQVSLGSVSVFAERQGDSLTNITAASIYGAAVYSKFSLNVNSFGLRLSFNVSGLMADGTLTLVLLISTQPSMMSPPVPMLNKQCYTCDFRGDNRDESKCDTLVQCASPSHVCFTTWNDNRKNKAQITGKGCATEDFCDSAEKRNKCNSTSTGDGAECTVCCKGQGCNAQTTPCPTFVSDSCADSNVQSDFSFDFTVSTDGLSTDDANKYQAGFGDLSSYLVNITSSLRLNDCSGEGSVLRTAGLKIDAKAKGKTIEVSISFTATYSGICAQNALGRLGSASARMVTAESIVLFVKTVKVITAQVTVTTVSFSSKKDSCPFGFFQLAPQSICIANGALLDGLDRIRGWYANQPEPTTLTISYGDKNGQTPIKQMGMFELLTTGYTMTSHGYHALQLKASMSSMALRVFNIMLDGPNINHVQNLWLSVQLADNTWVTIWTQDKKPQSLVAIDAMATGKVTQYITNFRIVIDYRGNSIQQPVTVKFFANMTAPVICHTCADSVNPTDCTDVQTCGLGEACYSRWQYLSFARQTVTKGCSSELDTQRIINQNSCGKDGANFNCTHGCMQNFCNYITPCPDWAPNCTRDRGAQILRVTNNLKLASAPAGACGTLLSAADLVSKLESQLKLNTLLGSTFGGIGAGACNNTLTFQTRVSVKSSGADLAINVDIVTLFQVKMPADCYREVLNMTSSSGFADRIKSVLGPAVSFVFATVCGSSASSFSVGSPELLCPAWYQPSMTGPPCVNPMLNMTGNVFADGSLLSLNNTQIRRGDEVILLKSVSDLTYGMAINVSGNYSARLLFSRAVRLQAFHLMYSSDFTMVRMMNFSCLNESGYQAINASLINTEMDGALAYNLTNQLCVGLNGVLEVRVPEGKSGALQMMLIGRLTNETIPVPSPNGDLTLTFSGFFNASSVNVSCINETMTAFSNSSLTRLRSMLSGITAETRINVMTSIRGGSFNFTVTIVTESCSDREKSVALLNTASTISILQTIFSEEKAKRVCAVTDNYNVMNIGSGSVAVKCIGGEIQTGRVCCSGETTPATPVPSTNGNLTLTFSGFFNASSVNVSCINETMNAFSSSSLTRLTSIVSGVAAGTRINVMTTIKGGSFSFAVTIVTESCSDREKSVALLNTASTISILQTIFSEEKAKRACAVTDNYNVMNIGSGSVAVACIGGEIQTGRVCCSGVTPTPETATVSVAAQPTTAPVATAAPPPAINDSLAAAADLSGAEGTDPSGSPIAGLTGAMLTSGLSVTKTGNYVITLRFSKAQRFLEVTLYSSVVQSIVSVSKSDDGTSFTDLGQTAASDGKGTTTLSMASLASASGVALKITFSVSGSGTVRITMQSIDTTFYSAVSAVSSSQVMIVAAYRFDFGRAATCVVGDLVTQLGTAGWLPSLGCAISSGRFFLSISSSTNQAELRFAVTLATPITDCVNELLRTLANSAALFQKLPLNSCLLNLATTSISSRCGSSLTGSWASLCCSQLLCPQPIVYEPLPPTPAPTAGPAPSATTLAYEGEFSLTTSDPTCLNTTLYEFGRNASARLIGLLPPLTTSLRIASLTSVSGTTFSFRITPVTDSCDTLTKTVNALNTSAAVTAVQAAFDETKLRIACAVTNNFIAKNLRMPSITKSCSSGTTSSDSLCCSTGSPRKRRDTSALASAPPSLSGILSQFTINMSTNAESAMLSTLQKTFATTASIAITASNVSSSVLPLSNGRWTSPPPVCDDIAPPQFGYCPALVQLELQPIVMPPESLTKPSAMDNSGQDPVIEVQPKNFSRFNPITGNLMVNFTATDTAGNKGNCSVQVELVDKTPPRVICPPGEVFQYVTTVTENVTAELPAIGATDLGGIKSTEYRGVKSGDTVKFGANYLVQFVATDNAGNAATCNFIFSVRSRYCNGLTIPVRNSTMYKSACSATPSGTDCTVTCPAGYLSAFTGTDKISVSCTGNSSWQYAAMKIFEVPECSPVAGSLALNFNAPYRPASSNCSGIEKFSLDQSQLQTVSCGFTSMNTLKFKISNLTEESIAFSLLLEFNSTSVDFAAMAACLETASRAIGGLNLAINSTQFNCSTMSGPATQLTTAPTFRCPPGTVKFNWSSTVQICLPCPPGSYQMNDSCVVCPVNFYQDEPGKAEMCEKCPTGTGTEKSGARSPAMCRQTCMAGFYSDTGLEPCQPCMRGYYAEKNGSTECTACPVSGDTTPQVGTANASMCGGICPAGQFSSANGVNVSSMCQPCPRNTWQNMTGQVSCRLCPDGLATAAAEAKDQSACTTINQCTGSPCLNGGLCTDYKTFYSCNCIGTGFYGLRCESNIDDCDSSPCMNGGNCTDKVLGYTCNCTTGYTGRNCEHQRNLCDELKPCVNGKCIAGFNSYSCQCAHGYSGVNCTVSNNPCSNSSMCSNNLNQGNCTQDITAPSGYRCACNGDYLLPDCAVMLSPCDKRPCENGGNCTASGTTRTCACPPGLTGDSCEIDIDESKGPNPCQNGGVVVNIFNGYDCQCKAPFTGTNCTNQTNNCDSSPCLNGGTCVNLDGIDNFTCQCVSGYTGFTCDIRVNPCDANPCVQANTDGPCQWTNGTEYKCNCLPGWNGTNCNVSSNPCIDFECKNSGTCRYSYDSSGSGTAFCDCAAGFTGSRCDENINDCDPNPCVNGFCVDGIKNYTCTCSSGWSGTNCDQLVDACAAMGPNVCANNGSCVTLSDGSYQCVNCSQGWTGQNCTELVDNCASKPCLNGGACTNQLNGFNCTCVDNFTGSTCELAPDYCLAMACKNGATCVNYAEYRNASCNCAGTGFSGAMCDSNINDCPASGAANACQNGGTCVDGINSFTCACTSAYFGDYCEKGGTSDTESFDISAVPTAVMRYTQNVSVVNSGTTTSYQQLTLTAYVRPTSLAYAGEMLRLARGAATIIQWNTSVVTFNNPDVASATARQTVSVNTGFWTSLVLTLSNSQVTMYINGTAQPMVTLPATAANISLSDAELRYGGPEGAFTGDYSQVNLFSTAFTAAQAVAFAGNCTAARSLAGDLISYRQLGTANLTDGFERRNPSVCQTSTCSDSFTGPSCSELRDTEPPRVVYCPDYISVISTGNRMTTVMFREPEFADNSGSFVVTKSIVNGTVLAWGEYKAIYQATDPSGNNAICQFNVYVTRYRCESLVMPNDRTISICATTPYGSYCKILCRDEGRTRLTPVGGQPLPPFYYCDGTGSWFPPVVQQPYTLPGCELIGDSPSNKASGNLTATIDVCNADTRRALVLRMINYFKSLNLCQNCTENDFSVSCVESIGRRRRQTGGGSASVSYSIPSTDGIASLCNNLKSGSASYGGTSVSGACPTITSSCPAGQVLSGSSCVLCPAGTYATTVSNECVPCPAGQYTSVSGSSACASCPANTTTPGVGASDSTMCYRICPTGQYMNETLGTCQNCPTGTYSDATGLAQCWSCPLGTAASAGASSSSGCRACTSGEQLSADGTCRPCPVGYYRDNNPNITSCQACPSGYTTPSQGSNSVAQCNIALCAPGSYRTASNTCTQCPLGTYQPTAGQMRCVYCGSGNTTVSTGAVAMSQCVRGALNECASVVWTWFCNVNTVCEDTADSFKCPCRKPNFVGEGMTCACAPNYSGTNCEVLTPTTTGLSTEAIIAISVSCAIVALAIIIGVTVYCVVKHKRRQQPVATYTVYDNNYAAEIMSTLSQPNKGFQNDESDQPALRRGEDQGPKRNYLHSDFRQSQF